MTTYTRLSLYAHLTA